MVEEHICPLCGHVTDKPVLFKSLRTQWIFSYIWDNPNCTTKQIRIDTGLSLIHVNALVTEISERLLRTSYRLLVERMRLRGSPCRFKIVHQKPQAVEKLEGIPDGTV